MPSQQPIAALLRENLEKVQSRIADAARISGRPAEAVTLVAVTKYVPLEVVHELLALGIRDLGENRVQQFSARVEHFGTSHATLASDAGAGPRWHMIGHLQRNKVRKLVPGVRILHSLDSLRLAQAVAQRASDTPDCVIDAFIEVNVSGEEAKDGLSPAAVPELLEQIAAIREVNVVGLMTMAPRVEDPNDARPHFARLRAYRDEWSGRGWLPGDAGLSMGMSNDYAVAIEEGATCVRVGSALYEGLDR